jgi:DNA-binding GntR family transcriptional regulator
LTLEPLDRIPTATLVSRAIRARIIDGTFPPGRQLTEAQLAEQLRVSRGPVREAFQRLIQEGLLVSEPHRGVFVVTLDDRDLDDLRIARRAIEREAARQILASGNTAAIRHLAALVTEMAAAARSGRWDAVADVDLRFHEALVAAADSPRLDRMYMTLLVETRLAMAGMERDHSNPRTGVVEHRALVKSLRTGNEEEVLALIDGHLEPATNA